MKLEEMKAIAKRVEKARRSLGLEDPNALEEFVTAKNEFYQMVDQKWDDLIAVVEAAKRLFANGLDEIEDLREALNELEKE